MIDLPPFEALALTVFYNPGVQALLLGSGISTAAGIPTGWEITLDLIRKLAVLKGVVTPEEPFNWYQKEYGKEPNYSEILDALASTPAERRAILNRYIDGDENEEKRKPTPAHRAIAKMVVDGLIKVIITTNFDRLLENALVEAGLEPTVIASDDAVNGATPLVHSKCTVIKIHGDYLDARIRNTDAELSAYSPAMNGLLDDVFDNYGLTVVGWSGEWDPALRAAIIRAPNRRYPMFWTCRTKPSILATDIINARRARVIQIEDADRFFNKLGDTVQSLRAASQIHPQSIEISLALAKKYCRDDSYALEWAEFLKKEIDKVADFAGKPKFSNTAASPTTDEIVSEFVRRTEILRRACMICGRWGTSKANLTVTQTISSLRFQHLDRSGYTWLIEIRRFAASIVFFWNLAGLLVEDNWQRVGKLLLRVVPDENGKSTELVSILPFQTFDNVNWKSLSGLADHHTPISDFLFEIFKREIGDLALTEYDADGLFDRVEILISFEHAQKRLEEMDRNEISWFWMPLGRFVWKLRRNGAFLREVEKIEAAPSDDPIFKAGLLGGSKAKANITMEAVRKFFEEVSGRFW